MLSNPLSTPLSNPLSWPMLSQHPDFVTKRKRGVPIEVPRRVRIRCMFSYTKTLRVKSDMGADLCRPHHLNWLRVGADRTIWTGYRCAQGSLSGVAVPFGPSEGGGRWGRWPRPAPWALGRAVAGVARWIYRSATRAGPPPPRCSRARPALRGDRVCRANRRGLRRG